MNMEYTIERCDYERDMSPVLQAEFASRREPLKEVWALYFRTRLKVLWLCIDEEDAKRKWSEEIRRVWNDSQMIQDLDYKGIPFVDGAEGRRMLEEMEMG